MRQLHKARLTAGLPCMGAVRQRDFPTAAACNLRGANVFSCGLPALAMALIEPAQFFKIVFVNFCALQISELEFQRREHIAC